MTCAQGEIDHHIHIMADPDDANNRPKLKFKAHGTLITIQHPYWSILGLDIDFGQQYGGDGIWVKTSGGTNVWGVVIQNNWIHGIRGCRDFTPAPANGIFVAAADGNATGYVSTVFILQPPQQNAWAIFGSGRCPS